MMFNAQLRLSNERDVGRGILVDAPRREVRVRRWSGRRGDTLALPLSESAIRWILARVREGARLVLAMVWVEGGRLCVVAYAVVGRRSELQRAKELRGVMLRLAEGADIVTVSHYHRDHFTPWYPSAYMATDSETYKSVYGGRRVLAKSPAGLNWSQRMRFSGLLRALGGMAEIVYADGGSWTFGSTRIIASQPLWHGPAGSRTGRVLGFFIRDGEEGLAFLPDVEGPVEPEPVAFVREHRPTIVIVGGPPTYLGWDASRAASMLAEIVRLGPHTLVLAHHLLRDPAWREGVAPVIELAERLGVRVTTYAGLAGRREEPLEAMRRELYAREPGPAGSAMSP